jgi:hypothetical protein
MIAKVRVRTCIAGRKIVKLLAQSAVNSLDGWRPIACY